MKNHDFLLCKMEWTAPSVTHVRMHKTIMMIDDTKGNFDRVWPMALIFFLGN
jgi:hypothetical protein